jgi:hypothetical protein
MNKRLSLLLLLLCAASAPDETLHERALRSTAAIVVDTHEDLRDRLARNGWTSERQAHPLDIPR